MTVSAGCVLGHRVTEAEAWLGGERGAAGGLAMTWMASWRSLDHCGHGGMRVNRVRGSGAVVATAIGMPVLWSPHALDALGGQMVSNHG